jgi:hypothetical protein
MFEPQAPAPAGQDRVDIGSRVLTLAGEPPIADSLRAEPAGAVRASSLIISGGRIKEVVDDGRYVRIRKQDHSERKEMEAILELYMSALNMN